jgi:hypothetical protein
MLDTATELLIWVDNEPMTTDVCSVPALLLAVLAVA